MFDVGRMFRQGRRGRRSRAAGHHAAETVAQVDPTTGEIVGEVNKDVAHLDGTWHATIHVWVLDHESRVLLQQRSLKKQHFPGMWDISAAGHIGPDESGVREVREELGVDITLDDLELLGVLKLVHETPGFLIRELSRVYIWRSDRAAESFSFSDGEVIALATLTVDDLVTLIEGSNVVAQVWRGGHTASETLDTEALVPLGESYWSTLLPALRSL